MSSWDGRRRCDQRRFGIVFRNIAAGVPAIAAMFISSGARNKEERTFKWTNSDWGGIGFIGIGQGVSRAGGKAGLCLTEQFGYILCLTPLARIRGTDMQQAS